MSPSEDTRAYDAAPYLPSGGGLDAHRRAAARCQGCPLYENATRTVFGKGDESARVVLVGEQPGDQENKRGEPFVGPAGRLLGKALEEVGIDRDAAYVTNAVKHFKFTLASGGKRRIHKAPDLREITVCRPWLLAELHLPAQLRHRAGARRARHRHRGLRLRRRRNRHAVLGIPV